MAPRLQGELRPDGRLELSLWAAGRLGSLRVQGLAGPGVIAPNRWEGAAGDGLYVAQSQPALLLRGVRAGRFTPATRGAGWAAAVERVPVTREGARRTASLPWGAVIIETRGSDTVVAIGADQAEAESALALSAAAIVAEADAHARRCDLAPAADPLLRSLVLQGTHAALSSIRRDQHGAFAGLAAGLAYSAPARTYFRDGYWTLQLLLRAAPDAVRDEIDLLARGVQPDGEAPSGVILSGPAQSAAWEALRQRSRRLAAAHRPGDWWSDHFDSPLFFILMIGDYLAATGDRGPADRHAPLIAAIFERYAALAAANDGLPAKPRHDRDWADNVYREGLVAYDLGLWIGALGVVQRLGGPLAPRAADLAATARQRLEVLWTGTHYADWRRPNGSLEPHLALDSLTLLRYDAVPDDRALAVLDRARQTLESCNNTTQRWGDWGMLCAFPPFGRRADTRAKSAFAFRYHNGGDWPWLDGLYARERLRRGLADWRYPLTRWWETSLAQGWAGPVEYFSPPFGRGSLLQGWSGYPAAVALEFAEAVLNGDPEP
jgi:glycogen debranching enzyme